MDTMLENENPVKVCSEMVGGEEHDDIESRTGGVEHYSWAEIPGR